MAPKRSGDDSSAPRKVNAQAILLRPSDSSPGGYDVLLQLRSQCMKCMPGYLAALGGCRDLTDRDSRETAMREVKEECGLIAKSVSTGPSKFAEGEKCDWYVILLEKPAFESKAKSRSECGDVKTVASLLPPSMQVAECYGHVWLPSSDIPQIDSKLPLMGGLLNRVQQAIRHLQPDIAQEVPETAGTNRLDVIRGVVEDLLHELTMDGSSSLPLEVLEHSKSLKDLSATSEEILVALKNADFEVHDQTVQVKGEPSSDPPKNSLEGEGE
ncbi:Uncharacterized protein SCF082_LOCUS12014 [Durusdinium trenchii]|uniref:Nudix hydrolase domain-containing protein n=1 Tax=Durusdinium trenchii TaxID=1381693 RepID=A0ABP0JGP5_9DINO